MGYDSKMDSDIEDFRVEGKGANHIAVFTKQCGVIGKLYWEYR